MTICYFCSKNITRRTYSIKHQRKYIIVCSECKHVYITLNEQFKSKRYFIVKKIFDAIKNKKRHCTICRFYLLSNTATCQNNYYTGIGGTLRHRQAYPQSYANHGCMRFEPVG